MTNDDFGRIFFPLGATGNDRQYITYELGYCYDFHTMFINNKMTPEYQYSVIKFPERGGNNNLVVKTCNDEEYNTTNTYTLNSTKDNITIQCSNIIVPQSINFTQCEGTILIFNNEICNIICLGGIDLRDNIISCPPGLTHNIIIGPEANFLNPVIYGNNKVEPNFYYYPGNKLFIRGPDIRGGKCYLNRYIKPNDKLYGLIHPDAHVIYPNNCKGNPEDITSNTWREEYKLKSDGNINQNSKTDYFPNLLWGAHMSHEYAESGDSKYHFENPEHPILFDNNKILILNTESEFVKYDIQLWDQCSVENGIYSFNEFVNIESNKDKYINIYTLENLFCDGTKYKMTGLLNNMPSTIYVGLIGNKDITINPEDDVKEVNLFGNNTQYTGTLYLHPLINYITFTTPESIINNINFPNSIPNTGSDKDTVSFIQSTKPRTLTISIPFNTDNSFDCIDKLTISGNTTINLSNIENTKQYKFQNKNKNKPLNIFFNGKTEQSSELKVLNISNNEYEIKLLENILTIDTVNIKYHLEDDKRYYDYENIKCQCGSFMPSIGDSLYDTDSILTSLPSTCPSCNRLFTDISINTIIPTICTGGNIYTYCSNIHSNMNFNPCGRIITDSMNKITNDTGAMSYCTNGKCPECGLVVIYNKDYVESQLPYCTNPN